MNGTIPDSQANTRPGEEDLFRSEIREHLDIRQQRRWIFPRAALVGAVAGIAALAFRAALTGADLVRNSLLEWSHHYPRWGWIFPVVVVAALATAAVALTRHFAPEASGSGIPHLEAVLQNFRQLDWKRVLPVKFIGGVLAIGSGLALGREGPTVQMSGAVADGLSRLLKVSKRERLTLISAGAGAGLAAAFNAPLSGLIFVLEEVRRDFQPIVFGAAFIATVIANIVARIGSGSFPVFLVPSYPMPPLSALPWFAVLGMAAGLLGVFFNRGLMAIVKINAKIPPRYILPLTAMIGGCIGLVGWFSPILMGNGHTLAEEALQGHLLLVVIPGYFLIRYLLTLGSYGTGAPGGIFAPLLVQGALLGLAVGEVGHILLPESISTPAVFAVVGMAAYFTAIVRAPLTGIMLILEMTGNYAQMLPLLVSCFCAYIIAEIFKELPIYESLLEYDLTRRGVAAQLAQPTMVEFILQPNAPFVGHEVRSLGLPAGCILVRCADGKREWVPKANTCLEAHMRISALVAPDAADSLALLKYGCGSLKEDLQPQDQTRRQM